jgi:hypothetical protein
MNNIELLPKYQALGLKLGIFSVSDIQSWVDDRIRETSTPSAEIIELARPGEMEGHELYNALLKLNDEGDKYEIIRLLLARVSKKKLSKIGYCKKLANLLDRFANDCNYDIPKDLSPIYVFFDEYNLAEQGIYSSMEDWHSRFCDFVLGFRDQ